MKILIVDDDEQRSTLLKKFLTERGFDGDLIETCNCSGDAKARLRQTYFDVLILDVVLPKRTNEERSPSFGIELLEQLSRSPNLKKPEKIIGITAHTADMGRFQNAFHRHCLAVIEAQRQSAEWKESIFRAIGQTRSSQLARTTDTRNVAVITIHGIRTFGLWQSRLQELIEQHTDGVAFHTYRYGYFSVVGLLVPLIRRLEVRRLGKRLKALELSSADDYYVFCHSFGTYLATEALREIPASALANKKITLVLSGSVLPSNFDWTDVPAVSRIVNDCGLSDFPLLMSQAFAPGLGMAGRTGFHGFSNERLVNRYHVGGHSLYFDGNEFMSKYWLPLLTESVGVTCGVERRARQPLSFLGRRVEDAARFLGFVSPIVTILATATGIWWIVVR